MITPEQLINDLLKQIVNLHEELTQAQQNIKDFELLALEWKRGHQDLEQKHKSKLMEYEQIVKELEEERDNLKSQKH